MELHQFFLFLAIILIAARLLSETVARFGIPTVIGELRSSARALSNRCPR